MKKLALSCLFSALLCAGSYISIPLPLGPVPLVLSNFFAVLSGLLLGPLGGGLAVALYLLVGALGFPVFSGGRGGIAHFAGPTGGYLFGYLLGAIVAGLILLPFRSGPKAGAHPPARGRIWPYLLGSFLAFLVILGSGSAGLMLLGGMSPARSLAIGVLPFLPGDIVKALLAALAGARLGPFARSLESGGARLG